MKIQNNKEKFITATITILILVSLNPTLSFASDPDAFGSILTKANSWVGGSAGKLITFTSLAVAGIMGVAGFPAKNVAGAIGVGLLLSSANSIVEMIF